MISSIRNNFTVAPLGLATNSKDWPQVSEWNWFHQNDNFQPPTMWDLVELDSMGSPGMRGNFVDHGFGDNRGDMFSHDGNYAVGGAGPGHPPYLGIKKQTFEHHQDHPYQFQHYEDNDYPKYHVEHVKNRNLES